MTLERVIQNKLGFVTNKSHTAVMEGSLTVKMSVTEIFPMEPPTWSCKERADSS